MRPRTFAVVDGVLYVLYSDEMGYPTWRKATPWQAWRHRERMTGQEVRG